MAAPDLVVTLDGRVHAAGLPVLRADDPLFSRGDGVFETLLVRAGRPCLLDAHLARFGDSAAIAGLPIPDREPWRHAIASAAAQWGSDEAVMRLVYGRGRGTEPVAFVTVSPVPARVAAARRDGVRAVTLDRGVSAHSVQPWSLAAAKSVSYAANSGALRHAVRMGADDVVFVSTEGFVLEGPRSTVVVASGGALLTPPSSCPILPGTTVDALFGEAARRGIDCAQQLVTVADLVVAQGVWLLSSVTLAARVHALDGAALAQHSVSADVAELLEAAIAHAS